MSAVLHVTKHNLLNVNKICQTADEGSDHVPITFIEYTDAHMSPALESKARDVQLCVCLCDRI